VRTQIYTGIAFVLRFLNGLSKAQRRIDVSASTPTRYDIIGDIHGHADELLALLDKLAYVHDGISYVGPAAFMSLKIA
jgi:hypothetical protein